MHNPARILIVDDNPTRGGHLAEIFWQVERFRTVEAGSYDAPRACAVQRDHGDDSGAQTESNQIWPVKITEK
jgi:hypothetical protein